MPLRTPVALALVASLTLLFVPTALAQDAPGQGGEKDASRESKDAGSDSGPDIVRVGALINDIQQLDLQSHSYNVDMYMWFKWDNPEINPARSFEFLNAFELWGHILTYETAKPRSCPTAAYYQVIRNQGKFNTKLPLESYPFDTQHLRVEIEDSHGDSTELVFVPDTDPVALARTS